MQVIPLLHAAMLRGSQFIGWGTSVSDPSEAEVPLRAELFSIEQMERHGDTLAQQHRLHTGRGDDRLLRRLEANAQVLQHACTVHMAAVHEGRRITPAGEWLLDNFYLIEEQIFTARSHFPKWYSRELPVLAGGPSSGLARVYDIALEVIAHGDGRVDLDNLNRFLAAYQRDSQLKLGELWAVPIMLRLALIENLRRIAARLTQSMEERDRATVWADKMLEVAEQDPKSLILVIADMARSDPVLANAFVAELVRKLQGHSSAQALPLNWIEQNLSESGLTIEQMVQSETQSQAVNQVCISNSIASLRMLQSTDWRDFVEAQSRVEQTLRSDAADVYAGMDFATRDHYRHAVEKMARWCSASESGVAAKAVQLAAQARSAQTTTPATLGHAGHVGHYLLGEGRTRLERALQVQLPVQTALQRWLRQRPLPLYLGAIAVLTLAAAVLLLYWANRAPAGVDVHDAAWCLMAVLATLACSQLAVGLVNWLSTVLAKPDVLPRMDFSQGMPPAARTLVVVPTMLSSAAGVGKLVEALEVRFLANQDPQLHYALLTDWCDATTETRDDDASLLALARDGIAALNRKYPGSAPGQDVFFLFHRVRQWNAQEQVWMGYERKRGKLAALNALLRAEMPEAGRACFAEVVGDISVLRQVRYVLTLDTDTQLQRDAARTFAATMEHPLNRPQLDAAHQRISAGYGILQPRMAVSLPSTNRSRYARLMGSEPGVDPYTRAVSDVYQDLFHEGSFIGKGMYDVDAFEFMLKQQLPDNRILSHDLLEGCYTRTGLLNDMQLYDDFPARYDADVNRRERWMRGDWQIASWLLPKVPGAAPGQRVRNRLSYLSQWKILDNLRRSLVAPALLGLLLLGWMQAPGVWSLGVLGLLLLVPLISNLHSLVHKPRDMPWPQHASTVLGNLQKQIAQVAVGLVLLPHEAWFSLWAIARTHVRIGISHKRLLEWRASDIGQATADSAPAGGLQDLLQTYARMWMAPALSLAAVLWLAFTPGLPGTALPVAMPWLLAWAAAPLLAWWLSRPLAERAVELNPQQTVFLRQLARRTWHFFERFVTAEEHWLPPDNFQEQPAMALAHRTSPTNMGMALLANVTAHDFGYISTGALLQRTAQTLDSMQALERYAGHFYNWYDTQSCQPLHPRYISAVDSGNLSGHLLTLRPALLALADAPVLHARTFAGLQDALGNLQQALGTKPAAAVQQALAHLTQRLQQLCASAPASTHAAMLGLDAVALQVTALQRLLETDTAPAAQSWAQALHAQCVDAQSDLRTLQGEAHGAEPTPIPSLRALADAGNAMAQARMAQLDALAHQATSLALADFGFLYDTSRDLFVVGYNVDDHRRDSGHYDLLASEARLCSFVAIALGQIPQDNWFALGRLLASTSGGPALLSWSGSMFEYLMPNLVMPVYPNTLLHQTNRAVVQRQIDFGDQQKVPWGISESGYNTVDAGLNYQYRAFGVPGLGLKRGLADDLVIAPYATALALTVLPEAACRNLQRLVGLGMQGDYGLFEAVDYTPARVPRGQISAVVRSYMAHHQGMSLLALSHALLDQAMPKRFAADPLFQATALLLQERASHATVFAAHALELAELRSTHIGQASPLRVLRQPDVAVPEVQLLSNGRYHLLISQAGGGYSRWKGLAVTRWREDATRDAWGAFCYVRDVTSGALWSVAHQPSLQRSEGYEAIFSEGRAEFRRRDEGIDTHTEIVVSPEDDIELRRMRITNRNRSRRTIELTSYAEVVLAPAAADATHPAFSNLFVQTEIVRERQAILCHRRPRSDAEDQVWLFHLMAVHGGDAHSTSYETDRMRFTGRGQNLQFPNVMQTTAPLSDSEGPVLDPIVAIRHVITLEPRQTVTVDAVLGVAESRVQVLGLVDKYRDRHLADRVPDLATTHAWVNLQQINASEANAQLFARLAGSVVYANPALRAPAAVLAQNRRGQSGLWGYGVSGDLPIVLVQVSSPDHMELVRQMVQAHAYWRLKGLVVDLVIWNEDHAGYRQALQDQIMGLIAAGIDANFTDRPGGIFVRIAEHMSPEDRTLFQTVARVILVGKNGTLAEQIGRQTNRDARELPGLLLPSLPAPQPGTVLASTAPTDTSLQFFNGPGGFSADGGEYVIRTEAHADGLRKTTPLPWVNVLANARFGTVVSESGSAYTWSENAHEFRYTPWSNDPVGDVSGEAIYPA